MTDPKEVEVAPPAPPKLSRFVIEYDPATGGLRSQIDGEMPMMLLIATLFTQLVNLTAQQIAANQQAQVQEKIVQAKRDKTVFMPDGTPYKPPRPPF